MVLFQFVMLKKIFDDIYKNKNIKLYDYKLENNYFEEDLIYYFNFLSI